MIPKFRAWLSEEQEMHNVLAFDTRGHSFLGIEGTHITVDGWCDYFEVDKQAVLMQSTGLKDKNGVEIFEGDLVKVSVHNGFDYYDNEVCVVRKSRFHSGLVCINPNNDMECRIFNQDTLEDYQYEVIGNIYEDKELMEVEG